MELYFSNTYVSARVPRWTNNIIRIIATKSRTSHYADTFYFVDLRISYRTPAVFLRVEFFLLFSLIVFAAGTCGRNSFMEETHFFVGHHNFKAKITRYYSSVWLLALRGTDFLEKGHTAGVDVYKLLLSTLLIIKTKDIKTDKLQRKLVSNWGKNHVA